MPTALLLIAHGSRNQEANDDLHFVATELVQRGPYSHVEACFLELAEPDIFVGGEKCVSAGARRVVLLPYFLSPGVHVRDDLQVFRAHLAKQFPGVEFLLAEPLGRHAALIEIVSQRAREAEAAGLRPNPRHTKELT